MTHEEALSSAEKNLDDVLLQCGFAIDHPIMKDWVEIKFALKKRRQSILDAEKRGDDNGAKRERERIADKMLTIDNTFLTPANRKGLAEAIRKGE